MEPYLWWDPRRHGLIGETCAGPGGLLLMGRTAAGVKVERPTGRTTLTPARAGAQSRYEGVALAAQFTGVTS